MAGHLPQNVHDIINEFIESARRGEVGSPAMIDRATRILDDNPYVDDTENDEDALPNQLPGETWARS